MEIEDYDDVVADTTDDSDKVNKDAEDKEKLDAYSFFEKSLPFKHSKI